MKTLIVILEVIVLVVHVFVSGWGHLLRHSVPQALQELAAFRKGREGVVRRWRQLFVSRCGKPSGVFVWVEVADPPCPYTLRRHLFDVRCGENHTRRELSLSSLTVRVRIRCRQRVRSVMLDEPFPAPSAFDFGIHRQHSVRRLTENKRSLIPQMMFAAVSPTARGPD